MDMNKATIKSVVKHLLRIDEEQDLAFEYDRHFDGGEWSGPAHDRMAQERQRLVLERFTPRQREALEWALIARLNEPEAVDVYGMALSAYLGE